MRLDLPELGDPAFETEIRVRYGDMDAIGHVNGAVYFRYLEELRMQWLESIDALPDPAGTGPVLINAFCTYARQIVYPATIVARLFIGRTGRSSVDTFATLTSRHTPWIQHATGGATIVWADYKAEASLPLPDWFLARLGR